MELFDKLTFTFGVMRSEAEHKHSVLFLHPLEEHSLCAKGNYLMCSQCSW